MYIFYSILVTCICRLSNITVCPRQIRTHPKICFYLKIHNFYFIISKLGQNKVLMSMYLILTKFRNYWVKNLDFIIKAYFWVSPDSLGTHCSKFNQVLIFKTVSFRPEISNCPVISIQMIGFFKLVLQCACFNKHRKHTFYFVYFSVLFYSY